MYHRDIKPGNIVFSQQKLNYMIIDFGEAERIEQQVVSNIDETWLRMNLAGTAKYLDPILYTWYKTKNAG